jgi:hypothetical protein
MMAITMVLDSLAREFGEEDRKAFTEEFGHAPGMVGVGDWDSAAWCERIKALEDAGMTREDYEECLDAWRAGFFNR